MTIFDYIKNNGNYSFEDKEFNEVDNVIFSLLSYVDYENIVSKNSKNKKNIDEVSKIFFSSNKETNNNITAVKEGIKLLKIVKDFKRYKNVNMFNYCYIGDENSQFSAVTFQIDKKTCYVAFEGTDQLISGWEEDFKMAYTFPVKAHVLSKKYIDKHFTFNNYKLIVGGHSKGGNLALTASMYSNYLVRKKIIKIYSNDGQGLRKEQINSINYQRIESKFVHIIPNYSVVGLLLRNKDNYKVIKSSKKGIMSHNAATWVVSIDHFKEEKLSRFSEVLNEGFSNWLDKYDDEKREIFVKALFDILRENNIENLLQIKEKKELLLKIIKSSKNINPLVKKMVFDLVKVLNKTNLEYPLF